MKVLTDNKYYGEIADVIREQNGTSNTYTPPQMVSALKDLFYEEVEGVSPITFQGIGENLLDYRIDGASGGVGDRTSNLYNKNSDNYGKNLFWTPSGILTSSTTYYGSSIISVTPGTSINRIYTGTSANYFFSDDLSIKKSISQSGSQENGVALTVPDDCTKFMFNISNTISNDIVYVVEGTTAPEVCEPYGYKVPVVVSGKNLLQNNAATQTINGVTFTVNDDGSVTCNGTANETVRHMIGGIALMSGVQYKMSGCPTNGANNTYRLDPRLTTGSVVISFIDNGNGVVYTPNADVRINVYIYIQNGYTCDNLTFYPMIRLASIEDDTYEPYIEPTTTNIYLDEPIEENESISLSDTNTNIPTIRGTNVLTVDTTVQPSNVYVKARKESQYETIMRERYEEAQAQLEALESGGE